MATTYHPYRALLTKLGVNWTFAAIEDGEAHDSSNEDISEDSDQIHSVAAAVVSRTPVTIREVAATLDNEDLLSSGLLERLDATLSDLHREIYGYHLPVGSFEKHTTIYSFKNDFGLSTVAINKNQHHSQPTVPSNSSHSPVNSISRADSSPSAPSQAPPSEGYSNPDDKSSPRSSSSDIFDSAVDRSSNDDETPPTPESSIWNTPLRQSKRAMTTVKGDCPHHNDLMLCFDLGSLVRMDIAHPEPGPVQVDWPTEFPSQRLLDELYSHGSPTTSWKECLQRQLSFGKGEWVSFAKWSDTGYHVVVKIDPITGYSDGIYIVANDDDMDTSEDKELVMEQFRSTELKDLLCRTKGDPNPVEKMRRSSMSSRDTDRLVRKVAWARIARNFGELDYERELCLEDVVWGDDVEVVNVSWEYDDGALRLLDGRGRCWALPR